MADAGHHRGQHTGQHSTAAAADPGGPSDSTTPGDSGTPESSPSERAAWWRRRQRYILAAAALLAIVAALIGVWLLRTERISYVTGTIIRDGDDPREQLPVPYAVVTATAGATTQETTSDATGFFRLRLDPALFPGESVTLSFRHPDYKSVQFTEPARQKIHIIRVTPKEQNEPKEPAEAKYTISNIRVRYGVKNTTRVNVGSAVKSFEVANTGNIPCGQDEPCSPDGKWKASVDTVTLDAGDGNTFGRARVSCIAGPCPFSKVEQDELSADGRLLNVTVRNWSDTVTYLVEAEVTDSMVNDMVRHSYPVIFGSSMNFTLPPGAQGPSIEAELNDIDIVFPLGPKLILSWASCSVEFSPDQTKLYRCKLKPGFAFGAVDQLMR